MAWQGSPNLVRALHLVPFAAKNHSSIAFFSGCRRHEMKPDAISITSSEETPTSSRLWRPQIWFLSRLGSCSCRLMGPSVRFMRFQRN